MNNPPFNEWPLHPNRFDISRHLFELFPPAFVKNHPDALVEIAYANMAGTEKPDAAEPFSVFELQKAADFAEAKSKAGFNIYVGAALRKDGTIGRASDADFLNTSYSWADFDKAGDDARVEALLKEKCLQSSMVVRTGSTPHSRFQIYLKLADSVTAKQAYNANEALEKLLGGDNVKSPAHLMRLAGTINYASKEKRGRGYVAELVTLQINLAAPTYSVDHLIGLAGGPSNPFGFSTKSGRDDAELEALLEASRVKGEWHNNIRDAIASMIGRGWSDSAIRIVCGPYCRDGANDTDLDALIEGGRKKWKKPDEEQAAPGTGPGPDADHANNYDAEFKAEPKIEPEPLQWLDMSNWDNVPVPKRRWAIRDRVPLHQVGLFSGEGGTGKSIVELMKNVAHVAAKDWFGSLPEQGPAFYLGAEDDEDEIHIRLAVIAKHYGITFAELVQDGLHVLPLLGKDAVLCAASGKGGRVEPTALYHQIFEAAGDLKPINISIDTLSLAFAGSEIDRTQVYGFAMHMQALAKIAGGSVTVLSHPSLAGIASGTGLSGSTAWHGAFRFRQYLKGIKNGDDDQPDNDLRALEFKKNQYGPLGQTIVLRYQNGLFLPENGISDLDRITRESKVDTMFMDLLRRFTTRGDNVSHKTTSPNFAPTAFAKEPEAKAQKFRKNDFEDTMQRLLAAGRILVETYGRPSQPSSRLVVKPPAEGET